MSRYRVSLFSLIIITVSIAFTFTTVFYFSFLEPRLKTIMVDKTFSDNENITQTAANYIETVIDIETSFIQILSETQDELIGLNQIADPAYYESLIQHDTNLIAIEILDSENTIMYSSREGQNRVGIDLSGYTLINELTESNQVAIGNPLFSPEVNQLILEIAYLGETCTVIGQLSIDSMVVYFDELQSSFSNKEFAIVDQHGIYIFDSVNQLHDIRARFSSYDALFVEGVLQNSLSMKINGQDAVVSTTNMRITPWTFIVYEFETTALRNLSLTNQYIRNSFIGMFLTFSILFTLFNRIYIHEIHTIATDMENFGQEIKSKRTRKTIFREFFNLHQRFHHMQDNILDLNNKLTEIAFVDELTGLGTKNKAKFDYEHRNINQSLMFAYVDIHRFSLVNARYGYVLGDRVMMKIADMIHTYFPNTYRVEGDEFILLESFESMEKLKKKLNSLLKELREALVVDDIKIESSLNLGIVIVDQETLSFTDAMQQANIALKQTKLNKGESYSFYMKENAQKYVREAHIEVAISDALANQDFQTYFQPIMRVKDRTIRGFEALSRWTHQELGFIRPDEFIPVLENTKKIHILDYKVLKDALRFNKYMMKELKESFVVSVNISVDTLLREDFTRTIDRTLDSFQYDPQLLELEITESTIIKDFKKVQEVIHYLGNKGVRFSEDDFGDAYSSLAYLSKIKIDTLKISRNFLTSISNSIESRVLVQTIIELSKRLGFKTVIEGIEDEQTLKLFEEYECDFAQGYYFYRPMSEEAIVNQLIHTPKVHRGDHS